MPLEMPFMLKHTFIHSTYFIQVSLVPLNLSFIKLKKWSNIDHSEKL